MCTARLTMQERPRPHPGRPGGGHQRLGGLVQHRKAHAPAGTQATRRSRNPVPGPAGTRGLTWDPRGGPPPAQAGNRSKIRPGAQQGYGPPPHVKPRTHEKEADQVTSPQQPPPGATAHTKPGVHETRDAPLNQRFGLHLDERDQLLFDQFEQTWITDPEVILQARNNTLDNFRLVFGSRFLGTVIDRMDDNEAIFKRILDDQQLRQALVRLYTSRVYRKARSSSRPRPHSAQ